MQAEDGIRDLVRSRGLGDVYKRQDLGSANLYKAHLTGAKLSGANLHGANLQGATLNSANLPGANLSGANLREVNAAGANLDRTNLLGTNLLGAYLARARLRGVTWDSSTEWPLGFRPPAAPSATAPPGQNFEREALPSVAELRPIRVDRLDLDDLAALGRDLEPFLTDVRQRLHN